MSKQELINDLFRDILNNYIIIYLNNILIYSKKTLKNYQNKIKKILFHFNKTELKFKLKKCRFYRKEIEFLKYIIGRNKIYINLIRITTVKE